MMNISRNKLLIIRFLLNPNSSKTLNPNSLISSTASYLSSSITPSIHRNSNHAFSFHRCFSVTTQDTRVISDKNVRFQNIRHAPIKPPDVSPKSVSQVIDVVRSSNGDCRSKLDSMDIRLSTRSVFEIFRVLSCERIPGLQFFEWVRDNNKDLYRNADVCSLMVDNCGKLDDYKTMTTLLEQLKHEKICLTDKAFDYLPVLDSSKAHAMESITFIISVLNQIGGSIRSSGVYAMIHMLCVLDSFELAKFVMELTEKKLNYYAILVREKCRRRCSKEAYDLLSEIRAAGCEPDYKLYNYIFSSLCKSDKLSEVECLLKEMEAMGVKPDVTTFDVFIAHSCRLGRMEFANKILKRLMDMGFSPRVSTHSAFVKGYYNGGQYEEAYAYVRDIEVKKMPATNKMYSLLARLHQRTGNVNVAERILNEMMKKGLKPDYLYYAKTVNVLRRTGGRDLAHDLQKGFAKFRVE